MLELDGLQERYLDEQDDLKWLHDILKSLGEEKFPYLKENLERNISIFDSLKQVLKDAEEYDFLDDDVLLVRYAIYVVNKNKTPMQNLELRNAIERAENIKVGLQDEIALADWAFRMGYLFNIDVIKGE